MKLTARFTIAALLVAGLVSFSAGSAKAQLPFNPMFDGAGFGLGGFGFGGYGGYGLRPSPYSLGQVPVPPYFSLHPPVYYSMPVARTYGHSPYAYPGFYRTPEVEVAVPQSCSITNPYVTPSASEADDPVEKEIDDDYAVRPLIINNPFVLDDPTVVDRTELASIEYLD